MAGTKMVSPGTFRALSIGWKTKILRALERQGLDHAMYAFVDERGNLTSVVRCCQPTAPCSPEAFRIRRRMPKASRELPAHVMAQAQRAARLAS